jgi:putative tryptophan/tyrosine transport system substrate-binding protein
MAIHIRRRKFIVTLGSAVAWPIAARAQQPGRIRKVAMLMIYPEVDPTAQRRVAVFRRTLHELGWKEEENVQIVYRWNAGDAQHVNVSAAELVELQPDVIICQSNASVRALQRETQTIPIIFLSIADPVGAGFIASLAKPGGNVTGFTPFVKSLAGKWLELLMEIAPNTLRIGVIQNPSNTGWSSHIETIRDAAPAFAVEPMALPVQDSAEIERALDQFAAMSNGGLIVLDSPTTLNNRDLINALASRHHLPTIYTEREWVLSGGLMCYGPDRIDEYRQAALYVDLILKGKSPRDLPVQAPVKFELVINSKSAKALGLTVPDRLLALADEVIE